MPVTELYAFNLIYENLLAALYGVALIVVCMMYTILNLWRMAAVMIIAISFICQRLPIQVLRVGGQDIKCLNKQSTRATLNQ